MPPRRWWGGPGGGCARGDGARGGRDRPGAGVGLARAADRVHDHARGAEVVNARCILLSYPGAVLLSLDGAGITRVQYTDTEHYRLTKDFLACPERYFRHLFAPDDEEGGDPRKR